MGVSQYLTVVLKLLFLTANILNIFSCSYLPREYLLW